MVKEYNMEGDIKLLIWPALILDLNQESVMLDSDDGGTGALQQCAH